MTKLPTILLAKCKKKINATERFALTCLFKPIDFASMYRLQSRAVPTYRYRRHASIDTFASHGIFAAHLHCSYMLLTEGVTSGMESLANITTVKYDSARS